MNNETENSIKLIEQLVNASTILKKNIDLYSKEAQNSSTEFKSIIDDYRSYVKKVTQEAHRELSSTMKKSIQSSVEASTSEIEENIKKTTNVLLNTMDKLQNSQKNLIGQTKWLSWKSLTILLIGLIVLIGSVFKISGDEFKRYQALKVENANLQEYIDSKHVILKTKISVCGNTPCIKLDTHSKRWGNNGEYILINTQ